jgi:hypothetical protein
MVFVHSISRIRPVVSSPKPPVTYSSFAESGAFTKARTLTASAKSQGKVLLVLYDVSLKFIRI